MLSYNRIAYEIDNIRLAPNDVQGISMLMHYDYPEAWHLNGNATFASNGMKFGKGCAYFPDVGSNITITNSTGMFNLNPFGNYELEAFVNLSSRTEYSASNGYYFYDGHTFKYFDTLLTWADAKVACEELGGHLATSTTADKNTFLTNMLTDTWASLGGLKVNEAWSWITDETWEYSNWRSDSPSSSEDAECLFIENSGQWTNDTASSEPSQYICEWDYDLRGGKSNIFALNGNVQKTTVKTTSPNGYSFYNGHTFRYFSTALTWANAKAACEALGGHLATSISAEKIPFFMDL